jgi:hypothetical protein
MSLTKAKGNMYEWCSHTHSYLTGKCPHGCKYCYVQAMCARFPNMRRRYSGPLAVDRKQLNVSYDSPAIRKYAVERGLPRPVIFIEHLNDLFAEGVPDTDIYDVINHCWDYIENGYVFQSKNPARVMQYAELLPAGSMIGTTAESDYVPQETYDLVHAPPPPMERLRGLMHLRVRCELDTFATVEPVLKMRHPEAFAAAIEQAGPSFVNVGADSKGKGLVEPTREELVRFLTALDRLGVKVKRKTNLERLMK